MSHIFTLPKCQIEIDPTVVTGPLETWRYSVGIGGINTCPMPEPVIRGIKALKPKLIRIFIQEFFNVYPEHGRFEWAKLDSYLDSVAAMGAGVVAAITIKPKPLYPKIDDTVWMPNDVAEWQSVIFELVKRYSVDKKIVTHWEVTNEPDIGEWGGSPYHITKGDDYYAFYKMTIEPVLKAFPAAKVGGPALAGLNNDVLAPFLTLCREHNTPLDFVSWHAYTDLVTDHSGHVERVKKLLEPFGEKRPEMMVDEWNNMFPPVSVEEVGYDPRQAANAAASLLAMHDAGLDWSFYYHIWDMTAYAEEFRSWFAKLPFMLEHWNEKPHRMGLFSQAGKVRSRYFVYQMIAQLGPERIEAKCDERDIRMLATRRGEELALLVINFNPDTSHDRVVTIKLSNLSVRTRKLQTFRIDSDLRWCPDALEMYPVEDREVSTLENYYFQIHCPKDTVTLVRLSPK